MASSSSAGSSSSRVFLADFGVYWSVRYGDQVSIADALDKAKRRFGDSSLGDLARYSSAAFIVAAVDSLSRSCLLAVQIAPLLEEARLFEIEHRLCDGARERVLEAYGAQLWSMAPGV